MGRPCYSVSVGETGGMESKVPDYCDKEFPGRGATCSGRHAFRGMYYLNRRLAEAPCCCTCFIYASTVHNNASITPGLLFPRIHYSFLSSLPPLFPCHLNTRKSQFETSIYLAILRCSTILSFHSHHDVRRPKGLCPRGEQSRA
jgi:hypothetical protein